MLIRCVKYTRAEYVLYTGKYRIYRIISIPTMNLSFDYYGRFYPTSEISDTLDEKIFIENEDWMHVLFNLDDYRGKISNIQKQTCSELYIDKKYIEKILALLSPETLYSFTIDIDKPIDAPPKPLDTIKQLKFNQLIKKYKIFTEEETRKYLYRIMSFP